MGKCLVLVLFLLSQVGVVLAETTPETWPVVFSETYRLEGGEVRQFPLSWEGIQVRRFYLRLHATQYFEAVVTRARDGRILFMGHFEPDYGVMIPWGRDEYAHLTLQSPWEAGLNITLTLATDPEEEGLEVYSFHLNRFLELYARGEMARAEQELGEALLEHPDDEVARMLQERFWEEQPTGGSSAAAPPGSTNPAARSQEMTRVHQLELEVEMAMNIAGSDSALQLLEAAPDFASEDARTVVLVLAAEAQVAKGEYGEASTMLQASLSQLADEHNRFEIYRMLARINRDLGNDHQLELIIEQALGETQDDRLRQEAESWRD